MWLYKILCLSLFISYSAQVVFSRSSALLCPQHQSTALLQFKQLFSFNLSASSYCVYNKHSSYPKMVYWEEGSDCCEWDGITCDAVTGHVIGLDLSCSWLFGSIDSNSSIFQLSSLQKLNLAYNDFNHSQISPSIVRFSSLTHLNLTGSEFSGQIPSEVSHLSKLVSLDLFGNFLLEAPSLEKLIGNLTQSQELFLGGVNFNSVVPRSLMNLSSLISLSLDSCGLTGNFLNNVFHLPKLQRLSLSSNRNLTGNLPSFNRSSPLNYLDLSFTSFSGELPDTIGQLTSLRELDLSNCNFSGPIPGSIGNLTRVTVLLFQSNHLNGKVPSSLSNLEKLSWLDLSDNNLEGPILDVLVQASLSQLTILSLRMNTFTGQFPSSFANLSQLSFVDLSDNQLTGPLPLLMIELPKLSFLNLGSNSLNGTIPPWLFTQPSLEALFLEYNQFSGHLGEFQYHSLRNLDLSNNRLQGPIPRSLFDLANLTDIYLSSNNLSDTVELDMFAKLRNLKRLDLSDNSLSLTSNSLNSTFPELVYLRLSSCNMSEIPVFLRTHKTLYFLDLSNNKIGGRIPKWLWNIGEREISHVVLHNNLLEGFDQYLGVPPEKSPDILDVSSNMLRGSLFIPSPSAYRYSLANNKLTGELFPLICNLTSLSFLDLSNNKFSGLLPPCLGDFSKYLTVLNLKNNGFHGTLPYTFANESRLRTLDISHNQLEGKLPRSLANCTKLEILNIGHNFIYDTFPFWLETLPQLQVLVLRSNRFYGMIDQSSENLVFTKLRIIDVSYNNFTGNLPSKYFQSWESMMIVKESTSQLTYMGNNGTYYFDSMTLMNKGQEMVLVRILTILTAVDFSNNKFHGEIPISIGKLKALHILNFSSNDLTGHIPLSLGNLTELESLDFSKNKLSGEIPRGLARLTFLAVFDVSQNNLTGPIPTGGQFSTFPNTSFEGNSGLCGIPMSKECWNVEVAQPPPLPSQKRHDHKFKFDGFGWEAVVIGYGFGAVIGLVIGSLILQRKEQWFMTTFGIRPRPKGKRSKKVR